MDLNDRELIFQNILPEEKFVDRRIYVLDDIPIESESEPEQISFIEQRVDRTSAHLGASREFNSTRGYGNQNIHTSGTHSITSRLS